VTVDQPLTSQLGRQFNLLWFGQAISQVGDYIAYFTLPAFVSVLTNRASDFAAIFAAENIPTLLFGFSAGVLLDRVSLRFAALIADVGRAAAFLLLALYASTSAPSMWVFILLSFAIGSLAAGFNAALPSFLPSIVHKDRLTTANARLSFTQQVAFVGAPALGGLIVTIWGFSVAFLINASTFVVSAVSLMLVRSARVKQTAATTRGFKEELAEGLRFVWREPMLRYATLAAAAGNVVFAFIESLLVLIGREVFGIDEFSQLGIVFGALGMGGVIGALTATRAIARLGLGRTVIAGMVLFALGLTGMALQASVVGVSIALLIAVVGIPWINVAIITIRQTRTPDHLLGRVTAASRSVAWGTLPIGALVAGYLTDEVLDLRTMTYLAPAFLAAIAVGLAVTPLGRAASAER
jgi:MFS family permease